MPQFKIGDIVERFRGGDLATYGVRRVVTSVKVKLVGRVYKTLLGFDGKDAFYYEENYRLVEKAEPTDQELADEYRASAARSRELRAKMSERGFVLKYRESVVGNNTRYSLDEYKFVKTITPEPIVTIV